MKKIKYILVCYVSEISTRVNKQAIMEDYLREWSRFRDTAINLNTRCSALNKKLRSVPDSRKEDTYYLAVKSWQKKTLLLP